MMTNTVTVRYSRGRGNDSQPFPEMVALADAVAARLRTDIGTDPKVLIGASLGALFALEAAQRLDGDAAPIALVVAACAAPRWCRFGRGQRLDDAALIDFMIRCGAPDPPVPADPTLRRSVLARLRRDLEMLRGYGGPQARPLSCPIVAVRGEDDLLVTDRAVRDWAEWTTGPFASITVPGPHLFFQFPAGAAAFWRGLAHHDVISAASPRR